MDVFTVTVCGSVFYSHLASIHGNGAYSMDVSVDKIIHYCLCSWVCCCHTLHIGQHFFHLVMLFHWIFSPVSSSSPACSFLMSPRVQCLMAALPPDTLQPAQHISSCNSRHHCDQRIHSSGYDFLLDTNVCSQEPTQHLCLHTKSTSG